MIINLIWVVYAWYQVAFNKEENRLKTLWVEGINHDTGHGFTTMIGMIISTLIVAIFLIVMIIMYLP